MESVFMDEGQNIYIGGLSKEDLKEYRDFLENYKIPYRDTLGDQGNTFGVEVEFEGVDINEVEAVLDEKVSWKVVEEADFEKGGEVVSPTLVDHIINWKDLKETCNILNHCRNITTSERAGAHVHVGAQGLKDFDNLLKLILLYVDYEDVLYRFGYMDRLNPRESIISCAHPLSIELARDYEEIKQRESVKAINRRYDRFHGINFNNLHSLSRRKEKNTIEFRFGNGTTDPILWQNYINLCLKMIKASNKDLDIERLENELDSIKFNRSNYYGLGRYDLPKAVEFADLIFDNALDKTNFLKQYIKNNEPTQEYVESKYVGKFTR